MQGFRKLAYISVGSKFQKVGPYLGKRYFSVLTYSLQNADDIFLASGEFAAVTTYDGYFDAEGIVLNNYHILQTLIALPQSLSFSRTPLTTMNWSIRFKLCHNITAALSVCEDFQSSRHIIFMVIDGELGFLNWFVRHSQAKVESLPSIFNRQVRMSRCLIKLVHSR